MIDIGRINQEWIETVSNANRKADKIFVEKVIRAFLLLEGLSTDNIPFVFKGGTSFLLLRCRPCQLPDGTPLPEAWYRRLRTFFRALCDAGNHCLQRL